jgi:hypothetical protein
MYKTLRFHQRPGVDCQSVSETLRRLLNTVNREPAFGRPARSLYFDRYRIREGVGDGLRVVLDLRQLSPLESRSAKYVKGAEDWSELTRYSEESPTPQPTASPSGTPRFTAEPTLTGMGNRLYLLKVGGREVRLMPRHAAKNNGRGQAVPLCGERPGEYLLAGPHVGEVSCQECTRLLASIVRVEKGLVVGVEPDSLALPVSESEAPTEELPVVSQTPLCPHGQEGYCKHCSAPLF